MGAVLIPPSRNLCPGAIAQLLIGLPRSGAGVGPAPSGTMPCLHRNRRHTDHHAQRTQIPTLPPLPWCAYPSPHLHQQSLALQALCGGAPMSSCPACQRTHTWDGSLPALFLCNNGIWCRRCEQIVVDIRSVMASREIDCPAVGNESCDCAVCIT